MKSVSGWVTLVLTPGGWLSNFSACPQVLEMKRSNALGILLSKMPAIAAMVAAIWSLDDAVLSRDQIEALLLQLPSKDEVALVRAESKAAGGAAAVRLAC